MQDLEERHLADLRFSEVTRALRALSSAYVERRESALAEHKALDGAGKRAAFALYYGPLHFLLVQHIVSELGASFSAGTVVDLGCGTGVAGAAIAQHLRVLGTDDRRCVSSASTRIRGRLTKRASPTRHSAFTATFAARTPPRRASPPTPR